jgi:hypothetical protein
MDLRGRIGYSTQSPVSETLLSQEGAGKRIPCTVEFIPNLILSLGDCRRGVCQPAKVWTSFPGVSYKQC